MADDSLEWIVKMADLLQPSDIPDHLHRPDPTRNPGVSVDSGILFEC